MRAGRLRHQVTIQRRVQMGLEADGAPLYQWQDWKTPYVEIEVVRGREHFDPLTKQRYSEEIYRFCTHFSEIVGTDTSMRLSHDGSLWDIKAILPDRQREYDCVMECTLQGVILGSSPLMGYLAANVPAGVNAVPYDGFTISAQGGTAPYGFSVASGSLPTGLVIGASSGAVSGTPTTPGVYSAVLAVTDASSQHLLPSISITIT